MQVRESTKNPAALPALTKAEPKQPNNEVRLHPLLELQRSAGNQAVVQLLCSSPSTAKNGDRLPMLSGAVQPKLKFGAPRDAYEENADNLAAQVTSASKLPSNKDETPTLDSNQKTGAPESKEKVFTDVVSAVKSDLDQAWSDATRTWKEWGGSIIRNKSSGEIKVEDYKHGQVDMMVRWRLRKYRPPTGYELIGEFHTHQYSPEKVKKWQKDVPSFTGEDVGFDTGDLKAASKYFKEDYVAIVVSGKTIFGLVVSVSDLAKKFVKNSKYGAAAIDEADYEMNWDFKEGKLSGDYGEKSWQNLKNVVTDYEKELEQPAGIEFFRINR